jgi:predicted MFS family arabinose efflux permease
VKGLALPRIALMLGNFVTGIAVAGVAAMLPDLARGLEVTIPQAGLLITTGAIVLCLGSPLMVWATSRFDRRVLLSASLAFVALGHFASALAPGYAALLVLRVLMMAVIAPFTPIAAGTVALITPEAQRPNAVAFVFLGWTAAVAAGLPAIAFLSGHVGWRATFAVSGVALLACAAFVFFALPVGLRGTPLSLGSWGALFRKPLVVLLLVLTVLQTSGQFVVFTYFAPLLSSLVGASVAAISVFFLVFGVMGFIGNLVATRVVGRLGTFATSLLSLCAILGGLVLWSLGAGFIVAMGAGVALWGLGFAAINSMQQARLIAAVPTLGSAAVSLNSSSLYIGQAIGSALGGFLLAHDLPRMLGYAAMAFLVLSLGILAMTRDKPRPI